MKIAFQSSKLAKMANSARELTKAFGKEMAERIMARLTDLQAAASLQEVSRVPPVHCHELTADRAGYLAIDLKHPHRLIFRPDHHPRPTKPDGGLDWAKVTAVIITDITDYH
jgi:plasmid maintenance system killer protein